MPDTESPVPAPLFPWLHRRATALLVAAVALLVWSILANQWAGKDCTMPRGYQLVITHGAPDHYEGCDSDGAYTDDYAG